MCCIFLPFEYATFKGNREGRVGRLGRPAFASATADEGVRSR
jgi:hypothetical protein